MQKVYISGPITGVKDYNRDAFCSAEKMLKEKEYLACNPLRLNGIVGDNDEIIVTKENTREYYLKRDVRCLVDCDFIYFLKGWENSRGAKFEKMIADELLIKELKFKNED